MRHSFRRLDCCSSVETKAILLASPQSWVRNQFLRERLLVLIFPGAKRVIATDGDEEVVLLLQENCRLFENVVVKRFRWGGLIDEPELDLVIAADVVFDDANHPALLESLASAPRLVLVVRKRHRKVEKKFLSALSEKLVLVRKMKGSALQTQIAVDATDIRVFEFARNMKAFQPCFLCFVLVFFSFLHQENAPGVAKATSLLVPSSLSSSSSSSSSSFFEGFLCSSSEP